MVLDLPAKFIVIHPKKGKCCFNEYKTIQSENTIGASFHTAENLIHKSSDIWNNQTNFNRDMEIPIQKPELNNRVKDYDVIKPS